MNKAFTLIELLIAVVVIAVGMVFVLGALSQCVAVLDTASKTIEANYLLNQKVWELDESYYGTGSAEGETTGSFETSKDFSWSVNDVEEITTDFGKQASFIKDSFNEETVKISWKQGRVSKDLSITRYVKRKKD
ncbi:MAG TPA: prepilin-type N-terminal cleavage/methylation domain-containing protein [Candidatus Omnitrophota bacterium]|nr:prepilin-type N-terminal cleavage/methylation domain-containing protein [Candidatus Omnitrophota bacterium]